MDKKEKDIDEDYEYPQTPASPAKLPIGRGHTHRDSDSSSSVRRGSIVRRSTTTDVQGQRTDVVNQRLIAFLGPQFLASGFRSAMIPAATYTTGTTLVSMDFQLVCFTALAVAGMVVTLVYVFPVARQATRACGGRRNTVLPATSETEEDHFVGGTWTGYGTAATNRHSSFRSTISDNRSLLSSTNNRPHSDTFSSLSQSMKKALNTLTDLPGYLGLPLEALWSFIQEFVATFVFIGFLNAMARANGISPVDQWASATLMATIAAGALAFVSVKLVDFMKTHREEGASFNTLLSPTNWLEFGSVCLGFFATYVIQLTTVLPQSQFYTGNLVRWADVFQAAASMSSAQIAASGIFLSLTPEGRTFWRKIRNHLPTACTNLFYSWNVDIHDVNSLSDVNTGCLSGLWEALRKCFRPNRSSLFGNSDAGGENSLL